MFALETFGKLRHGLNIDCFFIAKGEKLVEPREDDVGHDVLAINPWQIGKVSSFLAHLFSLIRDWDV